METSTKSMPDLVSAESIRAGLIRNGHRSLLAWCRKRRANYNTAWAAMHGCRSGPESLRVRALMMKDAHV